MAISSQAKKPESRESNLTSTCMSMPTSTRMPTGVLMLTRIRIHITNRTTTMIIMTTIIPMPTPNHTTTSMSTDAISVRLPIRRIVPQPSPITSGLFSRKRLSTRSKNGMCGKMDRWPG